MPPSVQKSSSTPAGTSPVHRYNRLKYEREQSGLATSTAPLPPVLRLWSCIARLLYFEGISYGFCDAYCSGHTGSRPERAVGSLLGSLSGKVPGTSSRQRPQLPAIHPKHAEPSRSRTWIAWKSVEEGARILAWVVATTRYRYVQHIALFSFVLQPILTLCTPSLPLGLLSITTVT